MTYEEKARRYADNTYSQFPQLADVAAISYLAGARKAGTVWHDLRKDPKDLPTKGRDYLVCIDYHTGHNYPGILTYDIDEEDGRQRWSDAEEYEYDVIAWCELPRFEEE